MSDFPAAPPRVPGGIFSGPCRHRLEKYNETLDNIKSTDIHEIIKVKGRPKGTAKYTPEEKRERARLNSRRYYELNTEKERERKRLEYHAKKNNN